MKRFFFNQRGAMFGMDARIAMVIFSLLAATAGYFSFGRVDNARTSALLKELQAISDSFFQYQIDMGTFVPFTIDGSDGVKDFGALYQSSDLKSVFTSKWNGPYYSIESTSHPVFGIFSLEYGQADRTSACTAASECFVWIKLTNVPAKIWRSVNGYMDENNGSSPEPAGTEHTSGLVMADSNTADPRILYYRSVERKR